MGPFSDAGVEIAGIALFAALAFFVWVFNKGRESAEKLEQVHGPEAPETPDSPWAAIHCSACGKFDNIHFEIQERQGLCNFCYQVKFPTSWHILSTEHSPRHNKTSTSGRADG
jgi:hypothetical protein